MAHKPIIDQNFAPSKVTLGGHLTAGDNSLSD